MNLGNKGEANANASGISAAVNESPVRTARITVDSLQSLPDTTFLRQSDLVRNPKKPEVVPLLPFSAPTLWRKVKGGSFPKPTMLGPKITAWRVSQIKDWLAAQSAI